MEKYKIKIDPSLNVKNEAFGVRVDNHDVFIPAKLAHALEHIPLGDNAVTVANFLVSFPTSVTNPLGFSPEAVLKAANAFIKLLDESGANVSSVHRSTPRLPRGAKHPGQLDQVQDRSSD
jgi:hypothetical protein